MLIHLQAGAYTGFCAEGAELEILRRALVKQSSNYKQLELLRGNSALGQDDWEKTRKQ